MNKVFVFAVHPLEIALSCDFKMTSWINLLVKIQSADYHSLPQLRVNKFKAATILRPSRFYTKSIFLAFY